jgi:hypothetical protein
VFAEFIVYLPTATEFGVIFTKINLNIGRHMKIALASCAKIQKRPNQPAWKTIERKNPGLLLLLGDNV